MKFEDLNKTLSNEEFNKMIAETMWMADRPRTWSEWFSHMWKKLFGLK